MRRLSFVVSAPSGTGKTTIIQRVIGDDPHYEFVISTTSRAMREGEVEGKNYFFVTADIFEEKIERGEFIEWAKVHENYYGITKKEIDRIRDIGKIPIFDVDVQGAQSLKKKLADGVFIFIVPPSLEVLRDRLKNRKTEDESQMAVRLNNAIKELSQYGLYDYIIVNDDVEKSCTSFRSIVHAELCRKSRAFHKIEEMIGGNS